MTLLADRQSAPESARPRVNPEFAALAWVAFAAFGATWFTLIAWRSLTHNPMAYLGPLLVLGALVAGLGTAGRLLRVPALATALVQTVVTAAVAVVMIASARPEGAPMLRGFLRIVYDAFQSANYFAPPVPPSAPSVAPLLILCGLACLIAVDFLAGGLGRPPLAGLVLLAVYSVPVSLTGESVDWWVFVGATIAFLMLMYAQQQAVWSRWGRGLLEDRVNFSESGSHIRSAASAIGAIAIVLALVFSVVIPTFGLALFKGGFGPGSSDELTIKNPMTDLRRDLIRGPNVPLLTATTHDPDPTYLRIAVLTRLNEEQWSSGDREVPREQIAQGPMPPLRGVNPTVPRQEYDWTIRTDPDFDSLWLPTAANLASISAPGDWRYDVNTMDFLSGDSDQSAGGLEYRFRRIVLDPNALAMAKSGSSSGVLRATFMRVPSGLDPRVRALARQVTQGAPTRFQQAQLLQDWFRNTGGFTYDDTATGTGDLTSFLFDRGPDGRRGYCEQFSSAMATMARTLGIPSRVAVGFLSGERTGTNATGIPTFTFRAHDLHAWPELYFPGSGWVRFEPTPADRARRVPGYTTEDLPQAQNPTPTLPTARPSSDIPSRAPAPVDRGPVVATDSADSAFPWRQVAGGVGGLLVLVLLGLSPRLLRRARSDRRWRALAPTDAAWLELRDGARDLAIVWPEGSSPRVTGERLARHFGEEGPEQSVPRRGAALAPAAVAAMGRIVDGVERARYARTPGDVDPDQLRSDVHECVTAWARGSSGRTRRLARWWPRSLMAPWRTDVVGAKPEVEQRARVIDHVG